MLVGALGPPLISGPGARRKRASPNTPMTTYQPTLRRGRGREEERKEKGRKRGDEGREDVKQEEREGPVKSVKPRANKAARPIVRPE